MKNTFMKLIPLLGMFVLAFALFRCNGDDPTGLKDSFKASDSVSESMFAHTDAEDPPVTGNFFIRVVSTGVSSAFVKLNGEELFTQSDFHNEDFDETEATDLHETNTIEAQINGSPGDQLCVQVYEQVDADTQKGIYEGCVDREAGPPNTLNVTITPTATPTP